MSSTYTSSLRPLSTRCQILSLPPLRMAPPAAW